VRARERERGSIDPGSQQRNSCAEQHGHHRYLDRIHLAPAKKRGEQLAAPEQPDLASTGFVTKR
jgi:hypothetical protein